MKYEKSVVCAAMLVAAEKMIAAPDKITSGALAEDTVGNTVGPLDPTACKMCALGFLAKELGADVRLTHEFEIVLNNSGFDRDVVRSIYSRNDRGFWSGGNILDGANALNETAAKECPPNDDARGIL